MVEQLGVEQRGCGAARPGALRVGADEKGSVGV